MTFTNRARVAAGIAAVAMVGALSACTSDGGGETVSLTVAMGHEAPYPGEEAVMYAIPKQLGLFDEFGLDVEYQPTGGSGVAIQLVEAGQADLGQGNPSALMAAIAEGVDVRGVYNIIPEYGSRLAVLPDSDIASPADLEGATIGVSSLSSSRLMDAQTMVREAGFDPDADVTFVAVGTGAQATSALTGGDVDGLYLWDAAYHSIELAGTELRMIDEVFPGAENILDFIQYASADAIENKGEALGLLGRAAALGQLWARDNLDEALDMFYTEFPNAATSSEEDRQRDLEVLSFTLDQFAPEGTQQSGWGEIPEDMVEATATFFADNGLIPEALGVDDYITNEFVDSYNDFTSEDVAALSAAE